MVKHTNEYGKECYKGVEPGTLLADLHFHDVERHAEDAQMALHTNLGSFTILDRLTGFGWRDVETGFRDMEGKFWLAAGSFDVRDFGAETVQEAIDLVKDNANVCIGI